MASGHLEKALVSLEKLEIKAYSYTDIEENPSTESVERAADFARGKKIEIIIGLGGGSAMDAAKACSLVLTQRGSIQDYEGYGKLQEATLPILCIPTTAGTGSEVQSAALISDTKTHRKIVIIDPKLRPIAAILDPELGLSQPSLVSEASGLDAIGHAIEAAVTKSGNQRSWQYSCEALKLGIKAFEKILEDPHNVPARASMLLAASYAGLAIEESMLGSAHACANPLTQEFGLRHGFAVGLALPSVIRFNATHCSEQYSKLAHYIGLSDLNDTEAIATEKLASSIEKLLASTQALFVWSTLDLPTGWIPKLASLATHQRTAQFNPRKTNKEDFEKLYSGILLTAAKETQ